jgi:hypothetical protein
MHIMSTSQPAAKSRSPAPCLCNRGHTPVYVECGGCQGLEVNEVNGQLRSGMALMHAAWNI